MEAMSFGLIISASFAALVTIGALQSALYAAKGRLWEIGVWTAATVVVMAAAGWCVARTLWGERPGVLVTGLLAVAPLPVTLALIARSWASCPRAAD